VVVRTTDDDPRTITALYHAVHAFSPGAATAIPEYADARFRSELASRRLIAFVFTALGLFALALAAVGVYGVLNYAVGQRLREFAMRIALGAVTRDVYGMVMHDALVIVLAGTGIGAFGAMAFGSLFNNMLVDGVYFTDVFALVGAECVIVSASLAACVGPALRASRVDPVDLMRAT
jgi:ABC-type antimicrobial peptide transport system permease subunit